MRSLGLDNNQAVTVETLDGKTYELHDVGLAAWGGCKYVIGHEERIGADLSAYWRSIAIPEANIGTFAQRSDPHVVDGSETVARTQAQRAQCKRVQCVETGEVFASLGAAARRLQVTAGAIGLAITRKTKCGGYNWRSYDG